MPQRSISDQPLQLLHANKYRLVDISGKAQLSVELADGEVFLQSEPVEEGPDGLEHRGDIDIEAGMLAAQEGFEGQLCFFPIGFFSFIQFLLVAIEQGDAQWMGLERFEFPEVLEHGSILLNGAGGDTLASSGSSFAIGGLSDELLKKREQQDLFLHGGEFKM
jgi:hypothetical protein